MSVKPGLLTAPFESVGTAGTDDMPENKEFSMLWSSVCTNRALASSTGRSKRARDGSMPEEGLKDVIYIAGSPDPDIDIGLARFVSTAGRRKPLSYEGRE